ncbi:RNA-binding protein [Candidatus Falkowbacteria bacterium]|nr:RNA-binding protein [Candidatus Falkowbacteria bacterium]
MAKKLYVGNLSYSSTEQSLREAFAPFGAITSVSIITDKMTGRSKGFGFVEMDNDDEAQQAIDAMNGKEVDGRTLTVNEARPMTERPPRRDFNRGGGDRGGFGGGNRERRSSW